MFFVFVYVPLDMCHISQYAIIKCTLLYQSKSQAMDHFDILIPASY